MRLSKGSVELETLSRLRFIHCGGYITNGFVECELNGAIVNWLSKHEDVLASLNVLVRVGKWEKGGRRAD